MAENKLKIHGVEAVVLDMDGVITQTAKVHKKAWRSMFNDFLDHQSEDYAPMTDQDYIDYVDGKSRYKGVESFLKSRKIELPYGAQEDDEEKETVCGLGNKKNKIFLDLIEEQGVDIYKTAIKKIEHWKKNGLKTAVVSSSRNCREILQKAGVLQLFDVRVDGVTSQEKNLKSKPNPEIFLEAVKELETTPENCVVFEDAVSGVQAGSRGDFAFVIGVNRDSNHSLLYYNGADIVIDSFNELEIMHQPETEPCYSQSLPSAFFDESKFHSLIENKEPVLFLDYDGTLSPIVKHPEDAVLSKEMKDVLIKCAQKFKVAIVSGRDMDDVKNLVDIEDIIYAGSHGFRISGPNGLNREDEESEEILPLLDKIETTLNKDLAKEVENVEIDRKRYAVAVHYRNVPADKVSDVKERVHDIVDANDNLKLGTGDKILEIKPNIDWHKGKAIEWIINELKLKDNSTYLPIFIGDDVTDEDGFKALADEGVGILVGSHAEPTAAKYKLKNVYQVRLLLEKLINKNF